MALVECGYGFLAQECALLWFHFRRVGANWFEMLLPTKHAVVGLEERVAHANHSQIWIYFRMFSQFSPHNICT